MKNWVETKLGDCIHFTNGYAFKSNQFTSDINDVPLIKGENVGKGKILWAESKYWKREDLPQLEKFILKPNDIVLAMDRPWVSGSLKYALITKDDPISLLVQRVGCLRAKSNIYFSFLKHIIGSEPFAMYIKNIMSGVAVPHISPKQIQAFTFNLPPLPIQRKIAETLTAYDDLIDNNLKRIKLLEEMAQITYEEWFVREKECFQVGCIGDLVDFQNGFAFKSEKFVTEGLPVIKIRNISQNTVDIDNTDFVEEDYASQAVRFKLIEGDLLIAMTGATVGKVGYLPHSEKDCHLNQRVGRFLKKGKIDNTHFVFCAIGNAYRQQQILNLASGAAQPNISGNQILSIECVIPKEELLSQFYEKVNPSIQLSLNLRHQNRDLKTARDLLLPRLMSGEIALKE